MAKKRIICLIVFIYSVTIISGSDHGKFDFSFRRISPVGGFTYGAISSIGEDANGFIWFGTSHGLYRYNTVDVQKFINNPLDSTTIPNNSIRSIFCDSSGNLWIGTARGVCTYDNINDKFINKMFRDDSGESLGYNIQEIFMGDEQNIYLLSSVALGKYNTRTLKYEQVFSKTSADEIFTCAAYDNNGKIWIGSSTGTVWLYETSNQLAREFCHHRKESIGKIFADESGLWIGYKYAGLDYTKADGTLITHYGENQDDMNKIHHNRVRDIYKDKNELIWVSTYKGISIIDKGKVINVLPQEISGLPYNSVYEIFCDSKNGIWIGTWSGGLAYRSDFDNRFIHSRKDISSLDSDDEFVSSFAEKNDGTLIIGTEFGNLNRFDPSSNRIINIPFTTENGKRIENIKSLLYDNKTETLWIGTFLNGLWYQLKNETVLRPVKEFSNRRISVYALEKSDSGLWIGTFGTGLFHYSTSTGKLENYTSVASDTNTLSNNQIRSIIISKDKNLWIGTNGGLNKFNIKSMQFKRFSYIPDAKNIISGNELYAVHEDNLGMIWLGTSGGGLNKYNPETNVFESIRMKDGLVGDDVYGIEEDKNGTLWISTDNGIANIDPAGKTIRNFYRKDELQGNQFNPGAFFQTSAGEIFFGDTRGFTFFTPEQMKINPVPPRVILTSLSVNNKPVDNHSEGSPLKTTLQTENELNLSYRQNTLTFNFVANNFLLPQKNRFKYRLLNYNNKWVEAGTQNFAIFTKVPPGNYQFEVVACNNDNLWNNKPTQIKLRILPPPWLSVYAYFIYAVFIVIGFYLIRKAVFERQKFKKELLLERLNNESKAKIHEMKLQFFTNISHEFRTPLTLITSPVNLLIEKFKPDPVASEYLLTMQRNSNRLLQLINQLIDVQKIELGKAALQPRKSDLIGICRNIISFFEMEAKDKNIHLMFNSEVENLEINIDPEKVDQIFFNILSNAMKFTRENGTIGINVYITHSDEFLQEKFTGEKISGDMVCVEFTDEGPGIEPDEINQIFDRFHQGKKHISVGTGIGLHMASEYTRMHKGNICVRSNPGSGSTFLVSLPLNRLDDTQTEVLDDQNTSLKINENETEPGYDKSGSVKNKTITILIIEDNYELRNYLKNLLSNDYRIVTAKNGKQGLEIALTIIPDLVITDIIMPQMNGFDVCQQLKNNVKSSHIPVIMLTALDKSDKKVGGLNTGADAYITKPFDENILIAQIENLIRTRRKLREIFSVSDSQWAAEMEFLSSDRILIEKATKIVEQNLNNKSFVVDDLASNLGISPSSLYRKLKVLTNQSPTEFIRYIRLKKAVILMNEGISNVDEIGFAVGFNSHSYFTSSFKKQFGNTPSDYLNVLKNKNISTGK